MRRHLGASVAALAGVMFLACSGPHAPLKGMFRSSEDENEAFYFSEDFRCSRRQISNLGIGGGQYVDRLVEDRTTPCTYEVDGNFLTITETKSGDVILRGTISADRRSISKGSKPGKKDWINEPLEGIFVPQKGNNVYFATKIHFKKDGACELHQPGSVGDTRALPCKYEIQDIKKLMISVKDIGSTFTGTVSADATTITFGGADTHIKQETADPSP